MAIADEMIAGSGIGPDGANPRKEPDVPGHDVPGLRGPLALAAVCLGVIVLGLVYAGASGRFLGDWTWFAGVGAVIVALFGILGALGLRNERRSRTHVADTVFMRAFESHSDPVLLTDEDRPLRANSAYMALAERVGVSGESGAPPALERLFAGGSDVDAAAVLFRLLRSGSGTETVRVLDDEGRLRAYALDVSELGGGTRMWRVRDASAERSVAETLSDAPVGLASLDGGGRVLGSNATLRRWVGGRPGWLEDFVEDAAELLEAPRGAGRTVRLDTQLVTEAGVRTPTVASLSWSELEDGSPVGSLALHGHSNLAGSAIAPAAASAPDGDISMAGDTFNAAPFAILELDSRDLVKAVVTRANPAFQAMVGSVGEGTAFREVFAGEAPPFLLRSGDDCLPDKPFEADVAVQGGAPAHVNVYIVCHPRDERRCWAYLVDVSQRRSLQEQLVQSQKMQAIGQLAAGVAHDFNNLLTAIRLNTDELLQRHPVGDPSYPELQRVNGNVMRAAALVKKLLAFSRKQTLRTEVLDVTETLSDVNVTLRQTLSERVSLDIVHGRDLPPIRADKSQLETVLINLCVNARDAMLDEDTGQLLPDCEGQITIRSEAVDAEGLPLGPAHDGRAVRIDVSDTGTGMPPEVMAKIFEPFFTTKPQGKGTGLGLATCYGIVQQSGGHLEVRSTPGEGTTFSIYLPATDPAVADIVEDTPDAPRAPSNLSGQGTILFVEDEESVRTIAAKTLRKRGYNVVEAGDGEEAYEWLEEGGRPDLLISDVVMPNMDGPTLLRTGREMIGDARIVFISGYAKEEFSDLLAEEPDVTFLPKPFTLAQLAEKVKGEIGEAR